MADFYNPYTAGNPVIGRQYIGRSEFVKSIVKGLEDSNQRVVLINGQRRIGKSSTLRYLTDTVLPEKNFVPYFDFFCDA